MQTDEAPHLGRSDNLVGDQNVMDPRCREHLRLAKLGTGDADCARRKFLPNELQRLLPLGMGPPADTPGAEMSATRPIFASITSRSTSSARVSTSVLDEPISDDAEM